MKSEIIAIDALIKRLELLRDMENVNAQIEMDIEYEHYELTPPEFDVLRRGLPAPDYRTYVASGKRTMTLNGTITWFAAKEKEGHD